MKYSSSISSLFFSLFFVFSLFSMDFESCAYKAEYSQEEDQQLCPTETSGLFLSNSWEVENISKAIQSFNAGEPKEKWLNYILSYNNYSGAWSDHLYDKINYSSPDFQAIIATTIKPNLYNAFFLPVWILNAQNNQAYKHVTQDELEQAKQKTISFIKKNYQNMLEYSDTCMRNHFMAIQLRLLNSQSTEAPQGRLSDKTANTCPQQKQTK